MLTCRIFIIFIFLVVVRGARGGLKQKDAAGGSRQGFTTIWDGRPPSELTSGSGSVEQVLDKIKSKVQVISFDDHLQPQADRWDCAVQLQVRA